MGLIALSLPGRMHNGNSQMCTVPDSEVSLAGQEGRWETQGHTDPLRSFLVEPQFYIQSLGFKIQPLRDPQELFRNFKSKPLGGDPGKDLPLSKSEVFICRMGVLSLSLWRGAK